MTKKQKLSRDEQEKAEMEKMQKRVENLLPQKADLPASISIQQAEELKLRVHELEVQLEQQSERADEKISAFAQKTNMHSVSSKNEQPDRVPEIHTPKANIAFLIALLLSVAHFIAAVYYLYLGWTSAFSQFHTLAIISSALGVLFGVSSVLSRRGQPILGIILVLGGVAAAYPPLSLLAIGVGLVLGPALMIAGPMIAFQVLPQKSGWMMTAITFASGLVMLLLDIFGSTARPSLPGIFIPLLAASVVGILAYFLVRQFRDYSLRAKLILAFSFTAISALLVTSFILYNNLKKQSLQEFRNTASTAATLAALQQNGDQYAEISSAEDPLYEKFRVQNLKIRRANPQFIYVFTVSKDEKGLYFVVDAGDPGEENIAAFGERYDDPSATLSNNYDTMTKAIADPDIYTDQYGSFLAGYAPIFASDGRRVGLIGVDIDANTLIQKQRQLLNQILINAILTGLISIALGYLFGNLLVKPVENLTSDTRKFADGDFSFRTNISTKDEVGKLSLSFNYMADQIQALVSGLEKRVADRTYDLELASEVGRTIAEKVDNLSVMLTDATEMIRARFNLYYTQVYLLDPSGQTITLRAGTGAVGQQLLQRGHHLLVSSSSLNGRAVSEKKPVIVADTAKNDSFLPNPLLSRTRSEMAIPLLVGDKVLGVLDMQSETPNALNEDNLAAFQVLAGQLSVAIQNATLFAQSEEARKQVEENVRQIATVGWQDFLNGTDRGEKIGYVFDQTEVKPLERKSSTKSDNALSVPITVTGATVGTIQVAQDEREWTVSENLIIRSTADQLAQHIENLRLLSQAEKYRQEAEQTTRRLTREGWQGYLQTRNTLAAGYSFNPNEVKTENEEIETVSSSTLSLPITVRDEAIGELMINAENIDHQAIDEIFSAVAAQLGDQIESLRLLEETEVSRSELQHGEARLRTLIENAPEAIVVIDLNTGLFADPNGNAMKIYGLSREKLIKVGPAQMSPPFQPDGRDSNEKAMEKINEAMQGGAPVFEWMHRNAQGIDFPCEIRLVRLPGEQPLVRASVTDITERKKSQDTIARRAAELQTVATVSTTASTALNPDELLQTVVDLTKERFNVYHTHIYLADDSWNTLLLAAGAGNVGRQMVNTGHAIQMDTETSLVARASRERKSIIVNDVRSEAGYLPNPMLPQTRSEMAVPMIAGDKVIGVFDVQADIVDHFTDEDANIYATLASQVAVALQNARLYVELAATVTQLRELDRLKSSFLANMSHELRTPLNSILGFADVMLEGLDGTLTPYMDNDLKLIQKNGQHLLHLINDVLDMAKIESGKLNLIIEKFNLYEIMEDVSNITSSLAHEKDIFLHINADADHEVEINADRNRLRQVMINLITNAMKFTEKGKIAIHIEREENNVLISVKDTGVGIHPSQLEAVFQEFTQVDSSTTRKAGGTGLGLPISRRLIEMHGGRLWAESTGIDGEGSTFYVFLPIEAKVIDSEPVTRKK